MQRALGQPRVTSWFVTIAAGVLAAIAIFGLLTRRAEPHESFPAAKRAGVVGCRQVKTAFRNHESGEWVTMRARAETVLPDAHGASTHQRFILECSTVAAAQTVLVENNVDVGTRAPVSVGAMVIVRGQYIWNRLGGLIHDTHRATGPHPDGWVAVAGRVFM